MSNTREEYMGVAIQRAKEGINDILDEEDIDVAWEYGENVHEQLMISEEIRRWPYYLNLP